MFLKKRQNVVGLFILIFAAFVVVASVATQEQYQNDTVTEEEMILTPAQTNEVDAVTEEFVLKLENMDARNNTLIFYTNHQEVHAYIAGELVYSLEKEESIFGRTPGAMWNVLSLPLDAEEIRIEVTQVFPDISKQAMEFQLGNGTEMLRSVVSSSVIDLIICLSILLIGLVLHAYWMLVFRKTNEQREVLYLGLFAIIFGIWAFGETQFAVHVFYNRAFWSYMAFTCLMTMCLPFLYFIREFLETEDKYIHKWIAGYIILETIVGQFLHLTGIASVKETVMFTMANIIFTMLYLFYAIIAAIKNKKNKRKIVANIAGLLALCVTAIADMGGYFVNVAESNQLGKLGFLVYAIILGMETARVAQERVEENHKAEIYREMAVKDFPTGCYNRNAYAEDTSIGMKLTGVQLITFDLNNLKVCNDTKGHMAGDKYIADAAHMIQEVFKGLGKVYRIGGDEFCVIARGVSEEIILERREALRTAIKQYRQKNSDEGFGIACGYATFDPSIDKDIEETRHRADLLMYENKKEIKAAN